MARHGGARGPRLRIFWSILLTVAVLAVPGAVVAWGRSTSTFTTERVVVTGAHMVAKKEARRALDDAFLSENLFSVTSDEVRRALRRQCYLADVEIDRDFPDTLRVRLVEHRPALAVLGEGRWFLVSDAGHVICEAPPKGAGVTAEGSEPAVAADGAAPGAGDLDAGPAGKVENALPRLRAGEALKIGGPAADARVRTAVAALSGVPRGLRRRVARLEVTKALRVTVTLRDGTVVRLGDGARLGDKVIALRAVTAAYGTRGLRPAYVDVSVPERPLGRPLLK